MVSFLRINRLYYFNSGVSQSENEIRNVLSDTWIGSDSFLFRSEHDETQIVTERVELGQLKIKIAPKLNPPVCLLSETAVTRTWECFCWSQLVLAKRLHLFRPYPVLRSRRDRISDLTEEREGSVKFQRRLKYYCRSRGWVLSFLVSVTITPTRDRSCVMNLRPKVWMTLSIP